MADKVKFNTGKEKHVVYKKATKRGEGKVGDIMVNHTSKNKGTYDTISLTRTANAKTVKQGVAAEKKWHKQNDKMPKMKTGGSTPAWTRSEGKNKTGGLNAKGVASYRAANPGSKLKMAVTTKPSKLDPGSKDAKRRKSFCARSAGQMAKFPKAAKDPNSRLRLARKKWNC